MLADDPELGESTPNGSEPGLHSKPPRRGVRLPVRTLSLKSSDGHVVPVAAGNGLWPSLRLAGRGDGLGRGGLGGAVEASRQTGWVGA
jgi:hypothetical protein